MPKPIGKRHAIFIQEMVERGETPEGQNKAYRIAFPNCKSDSNARSASHRLLRNVQVSKLINEGILAKQKIIQDARKEQLQHAARENILSQIEVDSILCDIITGKRLNEIKKPVFNPHKGIFEIVTMEEKPGATEIVSAIDKYNKRHGGYAPKKLSLTDERDKIFLPGEDD